MGEHFDGDIGTEIEINALGPVDIKLTAVASVNGTAIAGWCSGVLAG